MSIQTPTTHPRTIGWVGATALAVGGSNLSLFVLGALLVGQGAIPGQGTAAIPLLAIGLIVALLALPSWVELTLMWPNRVGGVAATCAEAFRPYSPVLANLTGVCYWWSWVPTCSMAALIIGAVVQAEFLPKISIAVLSTLAIAVCVAINLLGLRAACQISIPSAIVTLILAAISASVPLITGHFSWHDAFHYHLTTPFNGLFGKVTGAMAGLYLVGFAAPTFETAAHHAGETVDPIRNVPRAMIATAAIAVIYFLVLPIVWLGALGSDALAGDLSHTLGPVYAPVFGHFAHEAAVWFILLNAFHATLQPLDGSVRTMAQLSEDGLLPRIWAKRSRRDVPWVSIVITAIGAVVFVWLNLPLWMIAAANLVYLVSIVLVSLAVWLLRRDSPEQERPYRAPDWTIAAGVGTAVIWTISTVLGFEQFGLPAVLFGLALAYSGAILYTWRRYSDRRAEGTPSLTGWNSLHFKLTGSMLLVLALDAAGYLMAINHIGASQYALRTALEDIFVAVALLTLSVGLVLPGSIAHAAEGVAIAARQLADGTLSDLGRAMEALGRGDVGAARARVNITPIPVHSNDEVGIMATAFNSMQETIAAAAIGLDGAREGLIAAHGELEVINAELEGLNAELEQRVDDRTAELIVTQRELEGRARELSEQKMWLRLVIDTDPNFIFIKDQIGAFILVNKALAEAYGTTVENLLGKRDEDFNPNAEEVAHFRRKDLEVMNTLRDSLVEEQITDASGSVRWLQTIKRPFQPSGSRADYVLGSATDITQIKSLQAKVVQTEKLAALGEMVAGVAHEINNPLSVISGNAQLLALSDDPDVRDSGNAIKSMTLRAERIVRSLLTFSRANDAERQIGRINDVVLAAVEMCRGKLDEASVEVVTDLDDRLPAIPFNEIQIQQVLVNLINNAEHAVRGNHAPARRIHLTSRLAADGAVTLSVSDTGHGMAADTLARIFDPFFTTKDIGDGTGLGLSICHGIVEAHGGALTVESAIDQGATFTVTLPPPGAGLRKAA